MAQRAMAMSYAFEGNCKKTVQYEQLVFDYYGSAKNFFQQGETADEAFACALTLAIWTPPTIGIRQATKLDRRSQTSNLLGKTFGIFVGNMRKHALLPNVGIKPKRKSTSLRRRPSLTKEPIPSSSYSFHTWRATSRFMRETTRRRSKIS